MVTFNRNLFNKSTFLLWSIFIIQTCVRLVSWYSKMFFTFIIRANTYIRMRYVILSKNFILWSLEIKFGSTRIVALWENITGSNWPSYVFLQYTLSDETIDYLKQPTFDIWHWEPNEVCTHIQSNIDRTVSLSINRIDLKRGCDYSVMCAYVFEGAFLVSSFGTLWYRIVIYYTLPEYGVKIIMGQSNNIAHAQ